MSPLGLNRLRKKASCEAKLARSMPQGLKPGLYIVAFAARLKSCPFKTSGARRVFPQPVKVRFNVMAFAARLKPGPEKKHNRKFKKTRDHSFTLFRVVPRGLW